MVFVESPLARGIALAFAASVLSGTAVGQSQQIEKIEITGSNIKRIDNEGPAPVIVITREEIEKRGATTASEVLRGLTAQGGFTFDEQATNSFAPGTSGVGLRNLGQNATLVLVNGRRVANYGFAQNVDQAFVDLNSIPLGAIDRIEVLKDGASAIYGSDAIAGVVNIILRRDFKGVEVTAGYGQSSRSDGAETRVGITAGYGDLAKDRFNVMGVFDYFKRDAIYLRDRDISRTADHRADGGSDLRSPTGSPGTWVRRSGTTPGFAISQPFPSCKPEDVGLAADGGPTCFFNFNTFVPAVPETERIAGYGRFTWDVSQALTVFGEASLNKTETTIFAAPTPAGFVLPVGHNSNPFTSAVNIRYRYLDVGPRTNNLNTDTTRFVVGAKGTIGAWNWEAAYLDSKSKSTNIGTNYVDATAQAALVSKGVYNFVDPSKNSPALVDELRIRTVRTGDSTMKLADAKASGEIFKLPGGDVLMAVGAEHRKDDLADTPDPLNVQGRVVGSGGTSSAGNRSLTSGYLEFAIPVVKSVEVQAAIRFDRYSDFGNATKPKVAVRWQPSKEFLVRGSYTEGYRAPSLVELYLGETISFPSFRDGPRCNAYTNGGGTAAEITAVCTNTQRQTISSGNAKVGPETSKSLFGGFVFEPNTSFTFGVDYFYIQHNDIIDQPLIGYQLANEASFPGTVFRQTRSARDIAVGAPGALFGAGGDTNNALRRTYFNISKQITSGLDFDATYRINAAEYGKVVLSGRATYTDDYRRAAAPGQPLEQFNGTYYYPRFRAVVGAEWEWRNLTVGTFLNHTGEYSQNFGITKDYVSSWNTMDLRVGYKYSNSLKFALGVKNLFDVGPPFSDNETQGYDYTQSNPVGRFFYGSLTYSYK